MVYFLFCARKKIVTWVEGAFIIPGTIFFSTRPCLICDFWRFEIDGTIVVIPGTIFSSSNPPIFAKFWRKSEVLRGRKFEGCAFKTEQKFARGLQVSLARNREGGRWYPWHQFMLQNIQKVPGIFWRKAQLLSLAPNKRGARNYPWHPENHLRHFIPGTSKTTSRTTTNFPSPNFSQHSPKFAIIDWHWN